MVTLDGHEYEQENARKEGYKDGNDYRYEPGNLPCPCTKCKIAYLEGYNKAFEERKNK